MKNINYDKLAVAIINEYESDREESGRKPLQRWGELFGSSNR